MQVIQAEKWNSYVHGLMVQDSGTRMDLFHAGYTS